MAAINRRPSHSRPAASPRGAGRVEAGVGQRGRVEVRTDLLPPYVHPLAERRVEGAEHVGAGPLLGRDADADGAPGPIHKLPVFLGQFPALVQHGEAHHVEPDVHLTDLLHLQQPTGGQPRPRAGRVEPHVHGGTVGHCGLLERAGRVPEVSGVGGRALLSLNVYPGTCQYDPVGRR